MENKKGMIYLKLFEEYEYEYEYEYEFEKFDNFTEKDIIECIKNDGNIYVDHVFDKTDFDTELPVKPISIEEDYIIINIDNNIYKTRLDKVRKVEF